MGYHVEGKYDPETNIAWLKQSGAAKTAEDFRRLLEVQESMRPSDGRKVYVINDISKLEKVTYSQIALYAREMMREIRARAEMVVFVTDSVPSRFTAKLFEFVSSYKVHHASCENEALAIIMKAQAKKA
jgi:hypothetical protein